MNIDFNFVAEAVGHVAIAWALVRITPTVAASFYDAIELYEDCGRISLKMCRAS